MRTGWPLDLGDLPLAIVQAAGFMAETGMAAAHTELAAHPAPGNCCNTGTPESYPRSLAAVTQLIADRLAGEDPAAAELASLCAFLAPEPIPGDVDHRGRERIASASWRLARLTRWPGGKPWPTLPGNR